LREVCDNIVLQFDSCVDVDVTCVTAYLPSLSPPVKQGREGEGEGGGSEGDLREESNRLHSSYRQISQQLEQHQSRQRELQHYIKMVCTGCGPAMTTHGSLDSINKKS
jgi:hypothetical protein